MRGFAECVVVASRHEKGGTALGGDPDFIVVEVHLFDETVKVFACRCCRDGHDALLITSVVRRGLLLGGLFALGKGPQCVRRRDT